MKTCVAPFRLLFALCAVAVLGASLAQASTIPYQFAGQLANGGYVTGTFTLNTSTTLISVFDFKLDGNYLLSNNALVYSSSEGPDDNHNPLVELEAGAGTAGDPAVDLELDFTALPGTLNLTFSFNKSTYASGLYTNEALTSAFTSGAVSVAPEPASWALLLGGLLLASAWYWRRQLADATR